MDIFIKENLTRTENFVKMPVKDVYERYLTYCEHYKIQPLGKRNFIKSVQAYEIEKGKGTGNQTVFKGVYLRKCKY